MTRSEDVNTVVVQDTYVVGTFGQQYSTATMAYRVPLRHIALVLANLDTGRESESLAQIKHKPYLVLVIFREVLTLMLEALGTGHGWVLVSDYSSRPTI